MRCRELRTLMYDWTLSLSALGAAQYGGQGSTSSPKTPLVNSRYEASNPTSTSVEAVFSSAAKYALIPKQSSCARIFSMIFLPKKPPFLDPGSIFCRYLSVNLPASSSRIDVSLNATDRTVVASCCEGES